MAAALSPLLSVLRSEFLSVTVIYKGVQSLVYFEDDVATSAAVTAIRTAVGYIKSPVEAYMPVSSFSGAD